MAYFHITQSDGEVSIAKLTKKEVEDQAVEDAEYDKTFFEPDVDFGSPGYWPEGRSLLIKGQVVVPRTKEKVTQFEVE